MLYRVNNIDSLYPANLYTGHYLLSLYSEKVAVLLSLPTQTYADITRSGMSPNHRRFDECFTKLMILIALFSIF